MLDGVSELTIFRGRMKEVGSAAVERKEKENEDGLREQNIYSSGHDEKSFWSMESHWA